MAEENIQALGCWHSSAVQRYIAKTLRCEKAVSCPFYWEPKGHRYRHRHSGHGVVCQQPLLKPRLTVYSFSFLLGHSHFYPLPSVVARYRSLSVDAVQNLYNCLTESASITLGILGAYGFGQSSGKYVTWRVFGIQYLLCTYSRHCAADSRSKSPRPTATRIDPSG
jgi:hypothetical protein